MAKMRPTIFLTVGFFLLLGTLAAQGPDGDDGQFVILNAQYGNEYRHVDVTRRLQDLARHGRQFQVEFNTIKADPAPGRAKMLRVYARGPNGQERVFDYPDGTMFDGTRFQGWERGDWGQEHWNGGWNGHEGHGEEHDADRREYRDDHDRGDFVIIAAQYGTERNHVDVTPRLRDLARNDVKFRMSNEVFGVDPDYGRRKVLRIYARGPNGRERMFEYPEGSWIDGSQFRGWGSGEWGNGRDHWSGRWNVEEREEHEEHEHHDNH
ncbi:MAG TPA: hypothetical protein VFE08_09515 [Candidatus Sulfotelmatobacter sp.]|jgi:hypothetical protein|nr:hypothetical protein [Candidatus Sulfotelmatobacter sp.]